MPITDEELDQKRQRVEELRSQVAQEEARRVANESALVNEVTAAQLDAETTRLEAQLEVAKRANKNNEDSGSPSVLDAIKAEQAQADASLEAEQAASNAPVETDDNNDDEKEV
jgi:hypothetical protein